MKKLLRFINKKISVISYGSDLKLRDKDDECSCDPIIRRMINLCNINFLDN